MNDLEEWKRSHKIIPHEVDYTSCEGCHGATFTRIKEGREKWSSICERPVDQECPREKAEEEKMLRQRYEYNAAMSQKRVEEEGPIEEWKMCGCESAQEFEKKKIDGYNFDCRQYCRQCSFFEMNGGKCNGKWTLLIHDGTISGF